MPAVFHYPYTVRPEDIDGLGHANNIAYLEWMQSAALAHTAAQGWSAETYQKLGSGWVVRSHEIEYLQPAFTGDEIIVRTWVANFRKVTSLRRYHIVRPPRNDGDKEALLATAATDWAFIDYKTGQPRRIPPDVAAAFELVPDPPI